MDVSEDGRGFDRTWGTATRTFDFGNYEPTRPVVLDGLLDALDLGPEGVTFLDLGSGKGRAALIASQRPWRQVVGIEHRRALHRVAEQNLAEFTARGGPRCPVALFCGDVVTHPLPDGPLVAFLYNSFPPRVLLPVLERVRDRPAVRLAYLNPQHHDVVVAAGWAPLSAYDGGADPFWAWRTYVPDPDARSARTEGSRHHGTPGRR